MLDEPTASLDVAHQLAVIKAARAEAAAGAGVLVVLHDLNLAAAFADRVVPLATCTSRPVRCQHSTWTAG